MPEIEKVCLATIPSITLRTRKCNGIFEWREDNTKDADTALRLQGCSPYTILTG